MASPWRRRQDRMERQQDKGKPWTIKHNACLLAKLIVFLRFVCLLAEVIYLLAFLLCLLFICYLTCFLTCLHAVCLLYLVVCLFVRLFIGLFVRLFDHLLSFSFIFTLQSRMELSDS